MMIKSVPFKTFSKLSRSSALLISSFFKILLQYYKPYTFASLAQRTFALFYTIFIDFFGNVRTAYSPHFYSFLYSHKTLIVGLNTTFISPLVVNSVSSACKKTRKYRFINFDQSPWKQIDNICN